MNTPVVHSEEFLAHVNMDCGMTPLQGRVVFHQERIFRSAGGPGVLAHQVYVRLCDAAKLPHEVADFDTAQCRTALRLIQVAATESGMGRFRDVRTGWEAVQ